MIEQFGDIISTVSVLVGGILFVLFIGFVMSSNSDD